MAKIFDIADFSAPELDVYARLTENQLVNRSALVSAMVRPTIPTDRTLIHSVRILDIQLMNFSVRTT